MSGFLNVRVDYCDAQAAIITLNSREEGGSTRMGSTLQIDVGRDANVKLPEFLMTSNEINAVSDTEPTDQILERQGAQIKSMQALQQNSLVPADETDHHKMQELMTALHNERETTRALKEVASLVEAEFSKFLAEARLAELKEVEQRHGISSADGENADNPDAKRSAIQSKFRDASISEQVDLFKSIKNALDEQQKREAANNYAAASDLDPDAKHVGDTYRGADSTTDLSDSSQSHENDSAEDHDVDPESSEESESESSEDQDSAPEPAPAAAGGGTDTTTGDNKDYDEDSSHNETRARADEAVEEAEKAQEQATLSAEKAQETSEAAQKEEEDSSEEDSDEVSEESNNPQRDEQGGYQGHHQGGSTNSRGNIEDRPVKMDDPEASQEDEDNFRSKVNKLKVAQLSEVEEKHELDGEGNAKARKDALKEAYDNASDEEKEELSNDVETALEG